jgi:excisionase family DNA binding protein
MSDAPQSEWLTTEEAAAYLKVKPRSLLLWVRQGKVKAYALSGTKRRIWRFRKEDLDSALLSKPVVSCLPPAVLTEDRRLNWEHGNQKLFATKPEALGWCSQ